jgi:hypothetical protein
MRRVAVLLLPLLAACSTALRSVEVVQPTVISFVDARHMSEEERNVALDDIQFYMRANREAAKELGLEFIVVVDQPFRVGTRVVNTKIDVPLGFVLAAPGKEPRLLKGVQTDADFACAAQEYFGRLSSACGKQ